MPVDSGFFYLIDDNDIDAIIALIYKEYRWSPEVISGLFLDNQDYKGLLFIVDALKPKKK